MFKTRIGIISFVLALGFLVILGRLWQLQVIRFEKYDALASRDQNTAKMVPAIRGSIVDRYGEVLAEDCPIYDISVRIDRLKLRHVSMEDVRSARKRNPDIAEREAQFAKIALLLNDEPFVRRLADALKKDTREIAAELLKALDVVGRNWISARTPVRIIAGVDERLWLGLRAIHEDIFRIPLDTLDSNDASESATSHGLPYLPGLVCTISTRRIYPHGRLGCFVLGSIGEIQKDDEDELRKYGILVEDSANRSRYWTQLRDSLDGDKADRLEKILRVDPLEIQDLSELYGVLSKLRLFDLHAVSELGLSQPVRWVERPARIQLNEAEMLWMGVGLPTTVAHNAMPNRIIGETGIERWLNNRLRGKSGMKIRETLEVTEGDENLCFHHNSGPKEGESVKLSISIPWQSAVERALRSQEKPGAIVVLNVKTGEVLALASFPDFDPNLFAPPRDGIASQEKLRALLSDPNKPLLNRAIAQQYPLGSVMKTLVAAVALEKNLVSTTETFDCIGYIKEGSQVFHCDDSHVHGTVTLLKAIRCSCNVTFHQIGARIGVENLGPFAKLFLGRRMGIDLPGEVPGIYPDREWRTKTYPGNPSARVWTKGSEYLLAIGQGQMTCTVLQAAVLMATIGNGGTIFAPHVCLNTQAPAPQSIGISQTNLAIVREGMDEVVNVGRTGERGTAYSPFHEFGELAIRVAGKTSTAEHRKGAESHAWFAGFAPAENPQVAFAVLIEEGGHGGSVAAPLAYKFLKEIYGTRASPAKNAGVQGLEESKAVK